MLLELDDLVRESISELVAVINSFEDLIELLLHIKLGLANATYFTTVVLSIYCDWKRKILFNAFAAAPVSAEVAHFNLSLFFAATACGYVFAAAEAVG